MKTANSARNTAAAIVMTLCTLSLLLLPGCGQQSNNSMLGALFLGAGGDKGGSTLITAEAGGVVQLNDELTLTVPAEALADDLTISIERTGDIPAGDADGLTSFGQAYRFLPKGTGFDLGEPAVLEMYYDSAELARLGLSPETIQICYYDEDLKCYVPVNSIVDTAHNRVTALIEHFTVYLPMAQALLPTNNEPYVGLQAPWPTTIRAGAPIYVRATVRDYDGAVAGVTLRYRKLHGAGAGVWQEARMTKEANPQATLHTYGYLIPASFLTAADIGAGNDIEYRIEATDNLGAVQASGTRRYDVTRTYEAGSANINPATLDITAGFERFLLVRGVDNNGTAFSLVPETFTMAYGGAALTNRFAQGILLRAITRTPAGTPDQLVAGFDGESAIASINIYTGELESIEVLNTNGISIPGDLAVSEGTSYAFDVIGRDGYGNTIPVLPVWSADASIGFMDPDGVLDTTGCHGPGVVTASLAYSTDTQNVYVQSRAKEMTAFSINGTAGVIAYPFITVTLPWGTDVTGLVAAFTTSGTGVTVDGDVQESGVSANDFTDPVVYRVTAEDGSTQDYTVRVRMLSPLKDITSFSINGVIGTINSNTISLTLPTGIDTGSLIAIFSTNGTSITVGGVLQQSGVTANDFTNLLVYTVIAEDGSTKNYTIIVKVTLDIQSIVSHFAGSIGGKGYSDGIGVMAKFNYPNGMTNDGDNIYVADSNNHTIRKIVINTGEVTTIAGQVGINGSTDGIGTAARFFYPWDITTDGINLYIADLANNKIRKLVIATGEVTTFAGGGTSGYADGIGSEARFNVPRGITTDGTNLYVADTGNFTIRKIVIATSEVTTLAGQARISGSTDGTGTTARLYGPRGITTDGTNLYVADTENHTIRKIVIATSEVSTLAGLAGSSGSTDGIGSTARFYQPNGITTDGINLYIPDTQNHTIRTINIISGFVTTIAGFSGTIGSTDGTVNAALFNQPSKITTDGTNLYVADTSNNTIRKILITTGEVTTYSGMSKTSGTADGIGISARFNSPYDITTDGKNLYVADTNNHAIRKIMIATGEVTTLAGTAGSSGSSDGIGSEAQFTAPQGIITDGKNLYVADSLNYTLRKIVIATAEVTTLAGLAGTYGYNDGIGSAARFRSFRGITIDGDNLYVADNNTIRKVVIATGQVTTIAGSSVSGSADGIGTTARFRGSLGITTDGTNLFVADTLNHTIRKVVIVTNEVTTIAGMAGTAGSTDGIGSAALFNHPTGIVSDGINLYVADHNNNTLRKIVIATGEVSTVAGLAGTYASDDGIGNAARFWAPVGITINGNYLYLIDLGNHCIRKIE